MSELGRRVEFDPASIAPRAMNQLLTSLVIPRPIAWISTTSAEGVDNLAPHSFFTIVSTKPPVVQFTAVGINDTLDNVRATGQFVVNVAPRRLATTINQTAIDYPAGVDEFDSAGLEREASVTVRPPRVAASPAALECVVEREVSIGNSTVIMGRVTRIAVTEGVVRGTLVDAVMLDPVARLGDDEWAAIGEIFRLARLRYAPSD